MKDRFMLHGLSTSACIATLFFTRSVCADPTPKTPPIDIHETLRRVQDHQKQVEALREDYTFQTVQTKQQMDGDGNVKSTETEERETFFVNGHMIGRVVKREARALGADDQKKEDARVRDLVEKAQVTPPDERLQGPSITVSRVLDLVDLRNPRRESYHGRPAIVFEFVGRKDAKTHGMMEDASKKLQGTVWIDEADLQVAHLDVLVADPIRIAGGLLASVQKGSTFKFDQAPVERGLWLPVGSEANMQARLLLFKNLHERVVQRDFGFKCFRVQTGQAVNVEPTAPKQ
jgi:hypothetical protein